MLFVPLQQREQGRHAVEPAQLTQHLHHRHSSGRGHLPVGCDPDDPLVCAGNANTNGQAKSVRVGCGVGVDKLSYHLPEGCRYRLDVPAAEPLVQRGDHPVAVRIVRCGRDQPCAGVKRVGVRLGGIAEHQSAQDHLTNRRRLPRLGRGEHVYDPAPIRHGLRLNRPPKQQRNVRVFLILLAKQELPDDR